MFQNKPFKVSKSPLAFTYKARYSSNYMLLYNIIGMRKNYSLVNGFMSVQNLSI